MSPGRWQVAQRDRTIGAMSREKVRRGWAAPTAAAQTIAASIAALAYCLAPLSRDLRRRAGRPARAPVADARLTVLRRADGRLEIVRRVGAADRRRRMDRTRGLLSGAAVSVLSRCRLRHWWTSSGRRPRAAGDSWIAGVRVSRARRGTVLLAARRSHGRSGAGALCAGDLLRRPHPEVDARRVFHLPRAVVVGACRG